MSIRGARGFVEEAERGDSCFHGNGRSEGRKRSPKLRPELERGPALVI
jgi:hypothetical protein